MNYHAIANILSLLLAALGGCMLPAAAAAAKYDSSPAPAVKLTCCAAFFIIVGLLSCIWSRPRPGESKVDFGVREGYAAVVASWLLATLVCAIPFGVAEGFTLHDALFEAASGLTTTGASIIDDTAVYSNGQGLEGLSHGILLWRSILNWLGGIGIVFFGLLILPLMHLTQGKQLYNAEVPGIKTKSDKMTPRLSSSVKMILAIYILLTICSIAAYGFFGMPFFDAICHGFSTVSTGGFSTKNASLGHYATPGIQWSAIFFMFVSACNFSIVAKVLITRRLRHLKDEELGFFVLMVFIVAAITAALLSSTTAKLTFTDGSPIAGLEARLRAAAFQTVSLASTTGFINSDYEQWRIPLVIMMYLLIMIPCGCGGSTAGGVKCSRIIVMFKCLNFQIRHCISPRTLPDVRLNGERLDGNTTSKTFSFVALFATLTAIVTLAVLMLDSGLGIKEAAVSTLTCISNVGPGLGQTGPTESFAMLAPAAKLLLGLTMITGRLELYTMLVVFFPSFWRR